MPKMTAQAKTWQREGDARTLLDAEKIRMDKARMNAARVELNKQAKAAVKAAKRKR